MNLMDRSTAVVAIIIIMKLFLLILELSITSLAYNTWPRDVHLAVGLSNGEIRVYNSLPDSPKCVTSLVQPDLVYILIKLSCY